MLVSRTKQIHFLTALLIALAPLKPAAEDIRIGGVPVPETAQPGAGDAPFLGAWFGAWGSAWRTVLIVEKVEGGQITALYAVGPNGAYQGGHRRLEGRISGDAARLQGPTYTVDVALAGDDRLRARYNGDQGFAILSRGDLSGPHPWSAGASEMIATDLVEDGQPVRLETVIFRPEGDGPFPLAVLNHGSSGNGGDKSVFKRAWINGWLADLLVERGWLVAFPQRRGRGGSDGLYDEGFTEDRSRYTCDRGPTLKGADRALDDISASIRALRLRPDVADGPVLIGGMSRGGVLSLAWAGRHPDQTRGVVNFVGGWLNEGCGDAAEVNEALFAAGGAYPRDTLWLYGADDPFYSLPYSRQNFAAFTDAGGRGAFHAFTLKGENNGHWLLSVPTLWNDRLIEYLDALD